MWQLVWMLFVFNVVALFFALDMIQVRLEPMTRRHAAAGHDRFSHPHIPARQAGHTRPVSTTTTE